MADTILITASLRIEAPAELVRAQYRDIDHHIRHNVHPSIKYQWEPAGPGERKIRTEFRILGVPQFDISLLEDAPDGSFVIRYLEGTNAGMVLLHEFVDAPGGGTDVRLSVNAPATLARKILGPLFKIGARQVMNKALHEDKIDLEKGGYRPGAAGNIARALAPLEGAAGRIDRDAARVILAAAGLVIASDAAVDDAEHEALRMIAWKLGALAPARAESEELAQLALTDDFGTLARAIGSDLRAKGVAEEGLVAAAVAALVSHGMSLGELETLRAIADGAAYPAEDLGAIVERADAALSSI